jgi:protein-tyrosine phosphatase
VSGIEERLAGPTDDAQTHVTRVVALAAGERGLRAPMPDEDANIVDPYRRPAEVFDQMTRQVMRSLPAVAQALGRHS